MRGFYADHRYHIELLHRIGLEGAIRELQRQMKKKGLYLPTRKLMKENIMPAADQKEFVESFPDVSDRVTAVIMDQCRRLQRRSEA